MRQILQCVTDCYYKVGQVLQSETNITKGDVTHVLSTLTCHCFTSIFKLFRAFGNLTHSFVILSVNHVIIIKILNPKGLNLF